MPRHPAPAGPVPEAGQDLQHPAEAGLRPHRPHPRRAGRRRHAAMWPGEKCRGGLHRVHAFLQNGDLPGKVLVVRRFGHCF